MNNHPIQKLRALRNSPLFPGERWTDQGMNPPPAGIRQEMESKLNALIDRLIHEASEDNPDRAKQLLVSGLTAFSHMDTIDREVVSEAFLVLAVALGVELEDELMEWMYGFRPDPGRGDGGTQERITVECRSCKEELSISIVEREQDIPDFWTIGKCSACGAHNLLSAGPCVLSMRYSGFVQVQALEKEQYSESEALALLQKGEEG